MTNVPSMTVRLFPTMPLALMAVAMMATPPAIVLADENSLLLTHVASSSLRQMGYTLLSFSDFVALQASTRPHPRPSVRLAVHGSLAAMRARLGEGNSEVSACPWNHVENLAENDFSRFFVDQPAHSATVQLSGYPSAVGLVLSAGASNSLTVVAARLGL